MSGVGKTHLTKKTFAKFSNKFMSKGFARGFFNALELTYPKHIQQIEDVFCKYPEFNPPHWHLKKYLTGELCARCLSRNFYIDEAVINTAPLYILQDIDKNHPEILKQDIESTIEQVKQSGSTEAQDKLEKSLQRLQALANKYNAAEGIVFLYKGRRMKLTGSFAPINQALGTRFILEK